jgi:hypothetical protein
MSRLARLDEERDRHAPVVATEERTRATVSGKLRVINVKGHAVLPNRSRSDEPTLADRVREARTR